LAYSPCPSVDVPGGAGAFPFISQNWPPVYFQLYNIPNGTTVKSSKSTQGVFAQFAADGICQVSGKPLRTLSYVFSFMRI
jgi:hypothetical protein